MLLAIPDWAAYVRILSGTFEIYFYGSNPSNIEATLRKNGRSALNTLQYVGIYTGNTNRLPINIFLSMKLPKPTEKHTKWYLNSRFKVVNENNIPYKEALLTDLIEGT